MGKSRSCNNSKTTCSFLMKLATWIDSKVEVMHIFLTRLSIINIGCYGNLKLPLVHNGQKCGSCNNFKHTSCFLMKFATWTDSKVENMHIVLICMPNI